MCSEAQSKMLKLGNTKRQSINFYTSFSVFLDILPPSMYPFFFLTLPFIYKSFSSSSDDSSLALSIVVLFSSIGWKTLSTILITRVLFLQLATAYKKGYNISQRSSWDKLSESDLFSSYRKISHSCKGIPLLIIVSSISNFWIWALNHFIS